jgi:hypothetical protein
MVDYSTVITLDSQEWEQIVRLGAEQRIAELENELAQLERDVATFERTYGMSLEELQRIGLPDDAGLQAHEDYVAWVACEYRLAEVRDRLSSLKAMIGKAAYAS